MPRNLAFFAALAASLTPALARAKAGGAAFSEGQALVTQHCGVCHTKPNLRASQFGPSLDSSLFKSANAMDIRNVIANGSPDMPGFGLTLSSDQIDAVMDYIKQAQPAAASSQAAQKAKPVAAGGDN